MGAPIMAGQIGRAQGAISWLAASWARGALKEFRVFPEKVAPYASYELLVWLA